MNIYLYIYIQRHKYITDAEIYSKYIYKENMCVYKEEIDIYIYILLTSTFKYQRKSRIARYYYIDSYPLKAKIKN